MTVETLTAQTIVRESIDEILREFLVQPFFNVREVDYQAVLFGRLRARIPNSVPVQFAMNPRTASPHEWMEPRTSRVHVESCVGRKGVAGESVNIDVVVLRDAAVELPCHVHGPTALQETVLLSDVEVAIEIKNAPSKNSAEARKFAADVTKLAKLQQQRSELACFGLVIDQSISLPIARSRADLVFDWLDLVRDLRRHDAEPVPPFVEVWFVDPKELQPRRVFFAPA
jgi:hypothetical protein